MPKIELSPAVKAAKAAYQRAWTARNREKQHESQRRYWEKKGRELSESHVTDPDDAVMDNVYLSTCLNCDKQFMPKRRDAKYCSVRCRVSYNRIESTGKVMNKLETQFIGTVFSSESLKKWQSQSLCNGIGCR